MTRKSPSAPRQVELNYHLSKAINDRPYLFVNSMEMSTDSIVPDGEWLYRIDSFLNDPESSIGSDETERAFATAMITRQYRRYLNPALVKRLTRPLEPVKQYPSTSAAHRLQKVKRDIARLKDSQ